MPWTEATKRYRNSEKGLATTREWYRRYYRNVLSKNPEEMRKRRERNRQNHYRAKYGLTPAEADEMKSGGCDLCGTKSGKLNIDHCHNSGRVRGVLCNACNLMIGWLERAHANMDKIKSYLEREG